jgi:hypothetical protein
VALFRDAGDVDQARRLADRYITDGELPEAWQSEITALFTRPVPLEPSLLSQLRAARDDRARNELITLLTALSGVEATQETLDRFLTDLTIETGVIPDLPSVIGAVTGSNSIEPRKVGIALRPVLKTRHMFLHSAAEVSGLEATSGEIARSTARNPARSRTDSTPTSDESASPS